MPVFQRLFDPAAATADVVTVSLPDSRKNDGDVTRFARFPNVAIAFAVVTGAGALQIRWPATGSIRRVDLTAADQAALGVSELVELSPLPFAIVPVLRALGPGLPTFYLGFAGAAPPDTDAVVRTSDPAFAADRLVMGCVFQDRMALRPEGWIELIGQAIDEAAPSDAADWRSMTRLFDGDRRLHVRDAAGRPAPSETFALRFLDTAGTELRRATLATDAEGALPTAALPGPGEKVEIQWLGVPLAGDVLLPVLALYEAGQGGADAASAPQVPAYRQGGQPERTLRGLRRRCRHQ